MNILARYNLSCMAGCLFLLGGSVAWAQTVNVAVTDASLRTSLISPTRAAGTFTLINKSESDLLLQGVSSPACQSVTSNHKSQITAEIPDVSEDLFQQMALPRQAVMVFPRQGYHLLCNGLKGGFKEGREVPFTFVFRESPSITVNFKMEALPPSDHIAQ